MKKFRDLLNSGKRFIGTYIMFPCETEIEVMKLAGLDFLIFDLEHERLTFTEIMPMLRACEACGIATMVRVPGLNEEAVKKTLDMGASAIKFPGISSAEQAKKAVSLSKYPPEGTRGSCPFVRGNNYGTGDRGACYKKANQDVVVSAIIEGIEGIQSMEQIIAVPGLDTISVGNVDLSVALGVPGQVFHPKVIESVIECAKLCEKYGKTCSVQVVTSEDALLFKDFKGISHYHVDLPPAMLFKAYKELCEGLLRNS